MNATQLDLFNQPSSVPYVKGSETSKAAAEAVAPKVGPKERLVLLALYHYIALTDEAIDRVLHAEPNRPYRPRRCKLVDRKYVEDSGDRVQGSSGLHQVLWQLTPEGVALAEQLIATAPVDATTG